MFKRNLLLTLSLIVAQPTYSSTDKKVAELCLKASDFKGCVEIMSAQKDLNKFKVSKDSKINRKCDDGKKIIQQHWFTNLLEGNQLKKKYFFHA